MFRPYRCIIFLLFSLIPSLRLSASCGSASCPIVTLHPMLSGQMIAELSREYIDQDRLFVGSSRSFVGAIPGHHDEVRTVNIIDKLSLTAGLSGRLAIRFDLPFVHRDHSHIGHEDGGDTPEEWNLNGIGDAAATLSYSVITPDTSSSARFLLTAGVKLPTGATGLTNAEGETGEITIQPGTGSTDFTAGFQYDAEITTLPDINGIYYSLPLKAGCSFRFPGRGTSDYRFGTLTTAYVGTSWKMVRKASLLLQVNGKFQGKSDPGLTDEPAENTGGTWIYASPGLALTLAEGLDATAFVQIPFYQNVNGIQQTSPLNLFFNLAWRFNLTGSDD
jgi:hypothetical protein